MIVVIIASPEEEDCTIRLTAWAGTGTPAASYAVNEISPGVYESANITGLSGEFRVQIFNGDNELFFVGYVIFDNDLRGHATSEPSNIEELAAGIAGELDSVTINRVSPYSPLTQAFALIQDDDYIFANGTHVDIDLVEPVINLSTATATVSARGKLSSNCASFSGVASIIQGATNKLRIEWPNAGSGQPVGEYTWQAKIVDSFTNKKTQFEGPLTLKRSTDA